MSRDLGILTVGIVTTPFSYEGKKRILQAEEGINKLKEYHVKDKIELNQNMQDFFREWNLI